MISTKAEWESFRKRLEKLIPQLDKAKIIEHIQKEGIAHSTIYANFKRFDIRNSFKEGMSTGFPSKFTARMRTRPKKGVNNKFSVSQQRLGKKFKVHHSTVWRQLSKMDIRCYKREKTLKYTKEQAERSHEMYRKLANLLYHSDCSVVMDDEKKYFTFYAPFMPGNDNF